LRIDTAIKIDNHSFQETSHELVSYDWPGGIIVLI
jgi:hypothetical protein